MTVQPERRRVRLAVSGAVQGVGFRPFVYRRAAALDLAGSVCNTPDGAVIEIEGTSEAVAHFRLSLESDLRAPARIDTVACEALEPRGDVAFDIASSLLAGRGIAPPLPDLAACADCVAETFDPADRRYRYPFTSCVHCGPRYSVIEALPYDRERTAMRHFPLCPACQREYQNPLDRRFHAQTTACPGCGPQLSFCDGAGRVVASADEALRAAEDALRAGRILALKGLGGFQLIADARNERAVRRLRARKRRPAKPLALMVADELQAGELACMDEAERRILNAPSAPIVLLRASPRAAALAAGVAPGLPWLGIMLAYTPLHHLLLRDLGFPVVATSGNRSGDPIAADEQTALATLAGVADCFLIHDRAIVHAVDDSVVRVIAGRARVLRCARGFAPQVLPWKTPARVLGLGGHLKNSIALAADERLILGPHGGDLESAQARAAWRVNRQSLCALHGVEPQVVACDRHPDYYTTAEAQALVRPVWRVPHHLAHVLAAAADSGLQGALLGVAWDGSGYGGDGTLWGGEFIALTPAGYRRVAHLLPFALPGGGTALREPRRAALGVLYALYGEALLSMTDLAPLQAFRASELPVLVRMLTRRVNAPLSSSAGRLFDAVAALLGLCQQAQFEGQAAMAVEAAAEESIGTVALQPMVLRHESAPWVIDWRPLLRSLIQARRDGVGTADLAVAFHVALADGAVAVARHLAFDRVVLTGGCFQNKRLSEAICRRLSGAGFEPYLHRRIPPNDGGLALGQAVFALQPRREEVA